MLLSAASPAFLLVMELCTGVMSLLTYCLFICVCEQCYNFLLFAHIDFVDEIAKSTATVMCSLYLSLLGLLTGIKFIQSLLNLVVIYQVRLVTGRHSLVSLIMSCLILFLRNG